MRFSQLVKAHAQRYRHTVIALDGVTDMASRLPSDANVDVLYVMFDKRRGLGNLALFRKTVQTIAPDVLVTYNWGAIEWALANRFGRRRPHVHIEDGFGPEEATRQLARRIWTRRMALSGRHTRVILPSFGLTEIALKQWKLAPHRVLHIPNGIDCQRFAASPKHENRASSAITVGTLASLRKEKNIGRLIEAFRAVAETRPKGSLQLLIVGDGQERAHLEDLASKSGFSDHIRFVGATQTPEDWYRQMDVFALSSDTEQMPFSVLEAMAAGLPVVSPDVGDVAKLVADTNARLITPKKDDAAFRQAIATLVSDAELRQRLGQDNQRKARAEFDEAAYGQTLWRSLWLTRNPGAPRCP